jgi:hypothetical protein
VLNCGLDSNDDSKLVPDVKKLCSFLSTTNGLMERKDENDDGDVFNFMATMEYKHKSETATQQEARKIVSQVLNGSKVVVLDLTLQIDVLLFQAAIPNVDYVDWERYVTRKQLMTARKYHGKPFVEFLNKLFHTVEMPTILRGSGTAHMDDALSPHEQFHVKEKIRMRTGQKKMNGCNSGLQKHTGHVPSQISTLVQQLFLSIRTYIYI